MLFGTSGQAMIVTGIPGNCCSAVRWASDMTAEEPPASWSVELRRVAVGITYRRGSGLLLPPEQHLGWLPGVAALGRQLSSARGHALDMPPAPPSLRPPGARRSCSQMGGWQPDVQFCRFVCQRRQTLWRTAGKMVTKMLVAERAGVWLKSE